MYTPLGIPGLIGSIGPTSGTLASLVGMAQFDESKADGVIHQVIDRFAADSKGFLWVVGVSSTPPDLGTRLEAAGIKISAEMAGVALTELHQSFAVDPAIRVEEVGWEEMRKEADLLATAMEHGFTGDDYICQFDALKALEHRYHSHAYLAFCEDSKTPAGFSTRFHTSDPEVVCIFDVATVEACRGRGGCRSHVARMVADVRSAGAQAIITQAVRDTSAPIFKSIGFRELCSLYLYTWLPGGS